MTQQATEVSQHFAESARALAAAGDTSRRLASELGENGVQQIAWSDWSIKDVLGHLGGSLGSLHAIVRGDPPPVRTSTLEAVNEERRQERIDWPLSRVMEELESHRSATIATLTDLSNDAWDDPVTTSSGRVYKRGPLAWMISAHERGHHRDINRALGKPNVGGWVNWLNISDGGVPKRPIFAAHVNELGLEGDKHRARMHGGPTAALCLYAQEVIDRLQKEGHSIAPGSIGENLTVGGIDWSAIVPGTRLRIGSTEIEITRYTTPCQNIAGSFIDGDFSRVLSTTHPGDSRAYARIVTTGQIQVGDDVIPLPAQSG